MIVVTGSSGKTTLVHMLDAQLGDEAFTAHHANSPFGIPLNILGLHGIGSNRLRWVWLIMAAPVKAFLQTHKEPLYIAEVDAERPYGAAFLAGLLKPEVTLWVSTARTHSQQFDKQVIKGKFSDVAQAIAHEYGRVGLYTKRLLMIDGDEAAMVEQSKRSGARVLAVKKSDVLRNYLLSASNTKFELVNGQTYVIKQPLPEEVYLQVVYVDELMSYLGKDIDYDFKNYIAPPGRSASFEGVEGTTLIDSTYNSNLSSAKAVLNMFNKLSGGPKWLVMGDFLEQGRSSVAEHKKLAHEIEKVNPSRVILVGTKVVKHTLPELKKLLPKTTVVIDFASPKDALDYIREHLQGKELLLFKGSRLFEGIVEGLLKNKSDAAHLPRREKRWQKKREHWGL